MGPITLEILAQSYGTFAKDNFRGPSTPPTFVFVILADL